MIRLLKCEFKKFRSTYVNSLSFLGMLSPVLLITLMFLLKRDDFVKTGSYTLENYNTQLQVFFVVLVGPIITSFIAVFSVFYEYQQKTMKNLLMSPYNRSSLMLSKIIYVSVYIVLQYIAVALINVLCAFMLGLELSTSEVIRVSGQLIVAGATTVMLVPLMMFLTLLFKSFIPALVITVVGTVSNALTLNWEHAYVSPWAIPAVFSFITSGSIKIGIDMNIIVPVAFLSVYFLLFTVLTLAHFSTADQTS